MAYTKTTWNTNDPITQERMNKIEQGIEDAHAFDSRITGAQSSANTALTNAETNAGKISSLETSVANLSTLVEQGSNLGTTAMTQIIAATTENDPAYDNLDSRFTAIENLAATEAGKLSGLITEVTNARGTVGGVTATTLKQKIDDIDTSISALSGGYQAVKQSYDNAKGTYNSLGDRLTADESNFTSLYNEVDAARKSNGTLKDHFDDIDNAITAAKQSAAMDYTYGSIDARFEAIETEIVNARGGQIDVDARLDNIESNVSGLSSNKISTSAIANNLTTDTEGKVLDARQGKELEDKKVNYTDVKDNLTSTDTDKPLSANQGKVLKGLIDDMDTALDGRLDTIENDLNTASTGLKARMTAAENDIDTLESDLNTATTGVKARITALETTINTTTTGLVDKVSTLESTVNDATTGLAATKAIADAAATNSDLTTLAGRVTTLENEPKSATVVIDKTSITYNNDGIPTSIGETPTQDKDYLLQNPDDDKYYYWKYIGVSPNGSWKLISGGGGSGTGTSSAEFYSSLVSVPEPYSDTVDYFIGSNSNYIHYRYLNNQWVMILPGHLINSVTVDTSTVGEGANPPTKSRPIIKELNSNTNLLADFMAIKSIAYETTEGGTKLIWTNIDGEVQDVTITGGGGSGTSANATITRVTNGNLTTIAGETCEISFKFYATDASGDALATTSSATWTVNRAQVATSTVYVNDPTDDNDYNTFDITQYLRNGDNNITLTVNTTVDDQIISRTKTWSITVINFSLVWDYDESTINDGATINFLCTPYGIDINKTLHLKVGLTEQTQSVTTSGIPVTVTLTNNFNHGTYTAEMWMTAIINGETETTDHISHDFLVVEQGNTTPIIAATLPASTMNQYNTLSIPFVVYTPNSNVSNVSLAVDGTVVDTREVGRTTQTWHYTPLTSGAKVLTITTGSVTKTLNLTVNSININNTEIGGYTFRLKASELPSNNALKAWYYDSNNQNATKLQFSNNFDWVNGGIKTEYDENNQLRQYICVKSGTTMTIPYKMFATDPRTNGANFKIIFKIENCRDYDATIATNVAEDIGIQLNAHKATFQSTTTQINTQYGEEEYTELEFEVYKSLLPNGSDAPNQYMMAWVDGVIATARAYGGNFVQTNANAANFVIGSTDCDVYIYLVKYYPTVLSRDDHVTNFIADAPNAVEMIQRYNRNDILDADEDIDYEKLAQNNPDCRVWLYDIERMTKDKEDRVNVYNFQQIWEGGDQYYQLRGTNAKLRIQGTSSVNYRYGAANTDIDFGKKKAPNATLIDGYGNNLLSDELEYKGFKINDNSLPITYSNTKVNFASCEQVNNMCNAEWYQRYQPFPSLSARDCMEFVMGVQFIKDRHENEPQDGIVLFTEKGADFDSEKYYMYSIANMGTSKKNTHIFHSDDEVCIEIKENTTDAQKMKSFDSDWVLPEHTGNYEIRYPDIGPSDFSEELKDGWERFVTWMVNSNPNAATDNALAESVTFEPYTFRGHNREVVQTEGRHFEQVLRGVTVAQYAGTYDHDTFEYRMAKMLSECEDYMAMDSVIYHFCFIERHTMVDNVAKNTFWSSVKEVGGPNDEEGYWIWDLSKNYDNDTADGNNNNGLLIFDYGNEASDTRDGTPIFNGYDTVWFVFASNLYEACRAMFVNRESIGAWSSTNYHAYLLGEQRKVPERVWNECYWYDYLRTYENNVQTTWINFLDGGQKTHQRKHYETYEEIYDSSKYRGGFSHNQSITLRGEAIDYQTLNLPAQESKFTITMFNKCYLTIWIGTNYQTVKCAKGVPVTLYFYEDNDPSKGYMSLANSVIDIDSGSMVQAIGDLSLIYPSSGQFGAAKRLRSLQIGSDTAGYYNPNMNNNSVLTFNNKMLEYLYVQNLPQATYNLDLSNCPELKFLKASGSGFTGFVFANGGLLNEAYVNQPVSLVMRNLNSLTKANFHLTDPTAVTSLRLENCSLFDNYTFINELTNLNVLRLTNINWSLNTNTLLDRLVELMGIDEIGSTINQSYLSGNVELTGTVYEGDYDKYNNAWSPDLVIDVSHASQFINQHLVTYYNEDGIKLYECYINHGNNVIDPYYNNLLDSIPTKAADIQYQYSFGTTDNADNYIQYSGWRLSSDEQSIYDTYGSTPNLPVNGITTLIAVYSTEPQKYTVRWLLRSGTVVSQVTNQNYGGGYDLIAPTIKDVQNAGYSTYSFTSSGNNCKYSIMTGWEKLPTNIAPSQVNSTYDIYATWLERDWTDYSTILSSNDYSIEEKLLVLKEMSVARNTLTLADTFPVTLGYNGTKPAIELVSQPTRYIGNNATTVNAYTPFAVNKSFTMAIDFRFETKTTSADEAILLSCYDNTNDSIQGFKLFYNPQSASPVPQISFGDTSTQGSTNIQAIGKSIHDRGMVVIRHIAGDSWLYIYTGADASGLKTTYSNSSFRKAINWSAITSDAKIVLGGSNILNDNSVTNATGTLYSVKYWEEDLGEGECLQLASWCHETMRFAVQDWNGYSGTHSALNGITTANIVLHTLNASEAGTITEDSTRDYTTIGWDPSIIRSFYNNRLYQALPIKLQSILTPVNIAHRKADFNNNSGQLEIRSSGSTTTQDYVFAPSCLETGEYYETSNHTAEAAGAFAWYGTNQMKVLHYNNGLFEEDANYNKAEYTNLRFPYRYNPINPTVTVYVDYPSSSASFQAWCSSKSITLKNGDILIPSGDLGVAYIYVESTDINKGAPLTSSTDSYLVTTSGGWIESASWWTRSVPNSVTRNTQYSKFVSVNAVGSLQSGRGLTQGIVYSIAL